MKFYIGQQVEHIRFHYRGVIYDVDQEFIGSEEWYERMAVSKPPKDQPLVSRSGSRRRSHHLCRRTQSAALRR